ncbi:MFS general substrate transporter [Gonapodya prolifera JEL478]|uniref:MFS general substrate transporter n=1 Tax=Gonapodya prolifera (strain JEL478) TaxID=1344416 RepID=A0A139ALB3_GONPJ|nr:MFS general substrate transporter [Gonapodya prolifera JEL478]|eukprot:KXS17334.1 MFS general substrate transporter [Gonapodya prolifera JEL478]
MGVREVLLNHFNQTKVVRAPDAIERDKFLEFPPPINFFGKFVIPGGYILRVPFNRWALMPAAVIIQMCVGSFYAWSGYNAAIDTAISGNSGAGQAPNTFYIAIAFFGPTAAVLGPWMERVGPRSGALLGITGYFLAHMFAAIACITKQLWLLYVGYGFFGGCGLGIAYISPVSPLQKWFPDWRGLASGLAVAGFGLGSFAASYLQNSLIASYGVSNCFFILGCTYLAIVLLLLPILRVTPPGYAIKGVTVDTIKGTENINLTSKSADSLEKKDGEKEGEEADGSKAAVVDVATKNPLAILSSMNLVDAIMSWEFRMMFIMLFCNALFGLTTTSKLQDMVKNQFGKTASEASTVNAIFAVFNAFGRVAIPLLSDKVGRKGVYLLILGVQIVICASFPTVFVNASYPGFLVCIFALVACYGAGFGAIPAFLSDQFGARNTGATHGVILCTWSIGGIIGLGYNAILNGEVAKSSKTALDVYNLNFRWILPIIIVGFVNTIFIRTNIRDR